MTDNRERSAIGRLHAAWQRGRSDRDRWRRRVYDILEAGRGDNRLTDLIEIGLVVLILANVVGFVLETVPSIATAYGPALRAFEIASVAIFTVEYALRLWSGIELQFLRKLPPWRARLALSLRPYMLIDLATILPFYLSLLLPFDLRLLRILRLMRFLKLSRYSPAMHTLMRVLVNERRALMGALLLVMTALLFTSSVMYFLENEAQPDRFGSIPESAYWAIVTLTTVGYGDVTPITPLGRLFAGITMLMGLIVLALPIAIIAAGFSQEVNRRDFVLTWSMMAKIPLFAKLDSETIGEIMRYLNAHTYPPEFEVIANGQGSEGMYFIASGSIRMGAGDELGAGEFFGEIEMLDRVESPYAYVTLTRVRLLELHRDDFQRLQTAQPEICGQIRSTADLRRSERSRWHADNDRALD